MRGVHCIRERFMCGKRLSLARLHFEPIHNPGRENTLLQPVCVARLSKSRQANLCHDFTSTVRQVHRIRERFVCGKRHPLAGLHVRSILTPGN